MGCPFGCRNRGRLCHACFPISLIWRKNKIQQSNRQLPGADRPTKRLKTHVCEDVDKCLPVHVRDVTMGCEPHATEQDPLQESVAGWCLSLSPPKQACLKGFSLSKSKSALICSRRAVHKVANSDANKCRVRLAGARGGGGTANNAAASPRFLGYRGVGTIPIKT